MDATDARTLLLISSALLALGASAGPAPTDGHDASVSFVAPAGLVPLDRKLVFGAYSPSGGFELWVSDGKTAGTHSLKDIRAGFRGSYPVFLTRLNNQVLFAADDGAAGIELWRTDGTATGTERVKDIHQGGESSMPTALTHVGNAIYFIANDGVHGFELWKSSGTAADTTLVADIAPGATGSMPRHLTVVASRRYSNRSANCPQRPALVRCLRRHTRR
jgi:ELWxxDGT repeat protein